MSVCQARKSSSSSSSVDRWQFPRFSDAIETHSLLLIHTSLLPCQVVPGRNTIRVHTVNRKSEDTSRQVDVSYLEFISFHFFLSLFLFLFPSFNLSFYRLLSVFLCLLSANSHFSCYRQFPSAIFLFPWHSLFIDFERHIRSIISQLPQAEILHKYS